MKGMINVYVIKESIIITVQGLQLQGAAAAAAPGASALARL
jgi:hypothetical protein